MTRAARSILSSQSPLHLHAESLARHGAVRRPRSMDEQATRTRRSFGPYRREGEGWTGRSRSARTSSTRGLMILRVATVSS